MNPGQQLENRMGWGHVAVTPKEFPTASFPGWNVSFSRSSTPLLFLQFSNDPLQFSAFFPFYRLQDLGGTLGLAHWGLPSEGLAVLLDEGMFVLPTETN